MGTITQPDPVKHFIAVLTQPDLLAFNEVLPLLVDVYGPVDRTSKTVPFSVSNYYTFEMGHNLQRIIVSFERLISPGEIARIKLQTIAIEEKFAHNGKRRINLDPGYLDYNKVILVSTKFGGQKIYLEQGIYADLTLFYFKGKWQSFAWTFPDFRDGFYDQILFDIRTVYRNQRRSLEQNSSSSENSINIT